MEINRILELLIEGLPSTKVHQVLNTPTNNEFKMKLVYLAARFNQANIFNYIWTLEQRNRNTCIHHTFEPNEDGTQDYNRIWGKWFANNNLYIPTHKGDNILHIIIRFGAQAVFKSLMGQIIRTLRVWNTVLGPIDFEKEGLIREIYRKDSSDLLVEEDEKQKGLSPEFYDFMNIDGDIAPTNESEDESTPEIKKEETLKDLKNKM